MILAGFGADANLDANRTHFAVAANFMQTLAVAPEIFLRLYTEASEAIHAGWITAD
jgi:hypothetical protein